MSARVCVAMLATLLLLGVAGCAEEEVRGQVDLVYVEWDREPAVTYLVGEILRRANYNVSVTAVSNPVMWAAVAAGEADAHLSGWLPSTHGSEWDEHRENVVDLGPNYEDAALGLVVPAYLEAIRSIEDLVEQAERFERLIIGIDPDAGMMRQTAAAIEGDVGGLGIFELVEGSDATMSAALDDAVAGQEPIVVTGWDPHVKFARHDLRILEDPYGIYGKSEAIHTIVREELADDEPEVYALLSEIEWEILEDAVQEIMLRSSDGVQTVQAARDVADEYYEDIRTALPDDFLW